jgi:Domain of unknown function (DUF5666)
MKRKKIFPGPIALAGLLAACLPAALPSPTHAGQSDPSALVRALGTVKSISGETLVLKSDSGSEITVLVDPTAKLLRVEPGQKSLSNAQPLSLSDLQPGDRILVRGTTSADGKTLHALGIIAMKKLDIAQRRAREREEWIKNGVGGLVKSVDPSAGTVVITANSLGPNKDLTVRVTAKTILRRYAQNSVKFDDAKPAPIGQIKPGDQLRARGERSPDGTTMTADEIVSGSFRNIAGIIIAIDPSTNTLKVHNLATKQDVVVHITADSQMRKIPSSLAERIAIRLKGSSPVGPGAGYHAAQPERSGHAEGMASRGSGEENGSDLQRILARMPAASLSDLKKGDAVMIVATEGEQNGEVTAITLLSGVEPILQASPKGGRQMVLSPWSLGTGGAASSEAGAETP